VLGNNNIDSLFDPFELLLSLGKSCLQKEFCKFLYIFSGDHLVFSSFAKFDLFLVAQDSCKVLFNTGIPLILS
jgi:hypothetical protein